MIYFAYGSNMDADRMGQRGVKYTRRELGVLPCYDLLFNKLASVSGVGYANISPKEITTVFGVIYEVTEQAIHSLDTYEGYPKHYYRQSLQLDGCNNAIAYIANQDMTRDGLLPTKEYLNHLLMAEDILPLDYVNELKRVRTIESE